MHNTQRKVRATASTGGGFTKGNRHNPDTGRGATHAHKDMQRMFGERSAYEADPTNPFGVKGPSMHTLDKLADQAIAGLSRASASKGAHWGKVCPACGMQRSRNNLCFCNS